MVARFAGRDESCVMRKGLTDYGWRLASNPVDQETRKPGNRATFLGYWATGLLVSWFTTFIFKSENCAQALESLYCYLIEIFQSLSERP